ncbi:MAG: ABC transporter permease [Spirochaetales bacterium]|nr:ABC transporter permease [Spirochaetales bacterium]
MAETTRTLRYRGRIEQIGIFLAKQLRMFVYQSDWKFLPMAVVIAGLVSLVVRNDFFQTMEGTLKGALALSCVAIWNGCFNSVQVVCREREIVKREHRAGMHISSYIISHMLYQALLCLVQSALTIFVCTRMGIKFPKAGVMTHFMVLDIGITVFLISYATDMIALWISCLVHTTTAAMSIMPFLLIVQFVFSGGVFTLPQWSNGLSKLMVSNYGVKCIAAQADYNNLPMATAWSTVEKLEETKVPIEFTLGEAANALSADKDNPMVQAIRAARFGDVADVLFAALEVKNPEEVMLMLSLSGLGRDTPVGEIADRIASSDYVAKNGDKEFSFTLTIGEMVDMVGRDRVKEFLQNEAAATHRKAYYEQSRKNIGSFWWSFAAFSLVFGAMSVITLEFIDKDKR